MKAREFIVEYSFFPSAIRRILQKKGYRFLGQGIDQQAYLEPGSNLVVKIFGSRRSTDILSKPGALSAQQQSFVLFAQYCKSNPNNPFLPNFIDWGSFSYNGELFLQIRMERLFSMKQYIPHLKVAFTWMRIAAEEGKTFDEYLDDEIKSIEYHGDNVPPVAEELMSYLGEEGARLLYRTIAELATIAAKNELTLDLHFENFMLGSDGHIVISDPFHAYES